MTVEAPVADWVTYPELMRDPFPIFERLRAEGGVHWVPLVQRYLVTSYDAVHRTELDQETFSANEEGSLQIRAMGHSMLRRDDPEHMLERNAWQPALRPGTVRREWTAMFERNAERYLDELVARGPGADLIWDFSASYSSENLRQMLGLYNVDQHDMQRWSQTLINATGNYADDPEVWAAGERSFDEVDAALDEILPWHADHSDPSLLSQLLRIPDYTMPTERIRANIKMTIAGGLNEPRDALGVLLWGLLENPTQKAAVEADPALAMAAFEEAIRWIAPIGMYSRQTTREVDLSGVRLPTGARLGICLISANRDERVWPEPSRFDIRRDVAPHVAFAKGVHVCLGNWAARAAVASVATPMLLRRLPGLDFADRDAAEMGGWVFRGATSLPVTWNETAPHRQASAIPVATRSPAAEGLVPSIAVVGSGPAGCFSASALRRVFPTSPIDVFDALPAPFGLVRHGVAPDHQGTKSVTRQFERLFQADGVQFRGNVRIGGDLDLQALREAFDVVVLATGMHADAPLTIPGADLAGVYGAGRVTRLLNGHPGESTSMPRLGQDVIVVGMGNVAMDVVRLLGRDIRALHGTDVEDAVWSALAEDVRVLHIIGRSAPSACRFDPVMVREIAALTELSHVVHGVDQGAVEPGKDARLDAVRGLIEAPPDARPDARVRVEWWFECAPTRILGRGAVEAIELAPAAGLETVELRADSVVTAIGFLPAEHDLELVRDESVQQYGRVEPGLYAAGWLRRGPRGAIPDQRADARALAAVVADDVATGAIVAGRPGGDALPTTVLATAVDFDGWRRIDLLERRAAAPGRLRRKMRTIEELLVAARSDVRLDPAQTSAAPTSRSERRRVTVLFGTESGNGELVADDLRRHLHPRCAVEVRDLADTVPADLDPDRLHLIVCSTYGDGELPRSARPFFERLRHADLTGVGYAMLGLGDRSYSKTYSRGSELLDEALAAGGAHRVGEYGRHDASSALSASELAVEWVDGVLAEAGAIEALPV